MLSEIRCGRAHHFPTHCCYCCLLCSVLLVSPRRVALDDRLAALVRHLGAAWLGAWRGLLLGSSPPARAMDSVKPLSEGVEN